MNAAARAELQRGWPILLAAVVGLGTGLGAIPIYTLGAFTKPLADAFGWSRADVQGIFTWMTVGNLLAAPLVGTAIDRFGVRRVTLVSTLGQVAGYVAFAALAHSAAPLWYFQLVAFVTAVIGVGTVPVTWTRAVVQWFDAARGLALGLALSGTGLAATFLPSLTTWLVATVGVSGAYLGMAALPALLAFPLAWLLLREPQATALTTGGHTRPAERAGDPLRHVLTNYRFWVINASFVLVGGSLAGLNGHLIPLLTDHGMSAATAAGVAGVTGMAVLVGRLSSGYLVDRLWAPLVAAAILLLPSMTSLMLASDAAASMAVPAAVLMGVGVGAEFDLMAFLVSRYFGRRHYGTIYGIVYALFRAATGVGPLWFGYAFDTTGTYAGVLRISALLIVAGAMALLTLGSYPGQKTTAAAPTRT